MKNNKLAKLKNTYLKLFPSFMQEFERELKDCESVLDVGCGELSPLKDVNKKLFSVGVDIHKESIEKSKKNKIHSKYCLSNVLDIDKKFKDKSYDAVIALDLIEHLKKDKGNELLSKMEKIAKKKIIIFTPSGFLLQSKEEIMKNPYQEHLSGWTPLEMRKKNYSVIGIYGWKKLRKECSRFKFKPYYLWRIISDITQKFLRKYPEKTYSILCVKNKK